MQKDKNIIEVLLNILFLQLSMYKSLKKLNILDYYQFSIYKIIREEIQEVIFSASPFESAAIDSIPTVVWQNPGL